MKAGDFTAESSDWRLFMQQPVPTLVLDIKPLLIGLRALNFASLLGLDNYLLGHPELVKKYLRQVKVLAVNNAALTMSEARDETAFIAHFPDFFGEESIRALRSTLLQIADAKVELREDIPVINCNGRRQMVQFYIRPLYDGDLSQVICNYVEISYWKRAEESLKREQQTLKGSPVFSFRWRNAEGWPVESVSPNIVQLGYTPEELLSGKVPFAEMVHPDDLQRIADEVAKYSAAGEEGFEQDYRIYTASGEVRWIYDYTSIVRDPNGEITHYDGFLLDISSRKLAEQKLTESERELAAIFDNMQDTYYRTNAQGELVRVGPGVKEMLGYEADELLGLQLASLYANPEKRSEFLQDMKDSGGKVSGYQIEMVGKAGGTVWVSTSSQFIFDEKGGVAGVEGIARNITDIVCATHSLAQSERRLAEANRLAQLGHYEWNITHGEDFWSDEISSLLGYASPVPPSYELFFSHIHPEDLEQLKAETELAVTTPGPHHMVYRVIRKDGEIRTLESCGETITSEMGELRLVGTVRDITRQQREAEELREARDLAEQASRLKSDFLASMSHEIRTPMNGLIGFVNLLSRTELDSEQRDYVETMQTSMGDLLAIVNDILDFSRIESNKLAIQQVEFDLLEVLSDVISLFSGSARDKGLRLGMKFSEQVPLTLKGDPVRLRQVLGNLVGNALKFTDKGFIEMRCRVASREGDEFRLHFEVEDSGIGIPQKDITLLFDAFTQVHAGRDGGTGLGLAISQRLVELMGGRLVVESREGEGSTFSFTLPLRRVQQEAFAYPQPEVAALADYRGRRVLVVDDNIINRKLITTLLDKMGVETVEAEDGEGALQCHGNDCFDLILMDIRMPGMDGVEATRQIRKREATGRRVPIIALTAHAMPHEREGFILAGMDECLTKPIREEQLLELLQGSLG